MKQIQFLFEGNSTLRPLGVAMGTPLAWPVLKNIMHLTLVGGSLWRKQMSVCWNKRAPVEHVILFFCIQGTFVSEVWVLCLVWNVLGGVMICVSSFWHQMTHTTYTLCVWVKSTRTLFSRERSAFIVSFSLWESSALVCPFSREDWGNHLPHAARVQPLLRQRGDWDYGDHRWSLLMSLREELISRARQRLTRVNCWRRMYCNLHLLIQQEVLCWLLARSWLMRAKRIFLSLLSLSAPRMKSCWKLCFTFQLWVVPSHNTHLGRSKTPTPSIDRFWRCQEFHGYFPCQ